MSGIAGIVRFDRPAFSQEERLETLLRALRHRGPDGSDTFFSSFAALACARLSTTDVEHDLQPMRSDDGRFVIIFDGAIYNHVELREELREHWTFRTASDTEVILAAWAAWGEASLHRFNGMFAFFLWDNQEKAGFAARDGLGMKPFVFRYYDNELLFASEAKALLLLLPPPRASRPAILEYLVAPAMSGVEQPMFEGLEYLPPGSLLRVDRDGMELSRYWDYEIPGHLDDDADWLAEEIRLRLTSAVHRQCRSDRSVGLLLSGGLDSALLATLGCRNQSFRADGDVPHCFTIRFADQERFNYRRSLFVTSDDLPHAYDMARRLGLRQEIVDADRSTLAEDLERLTLVNDALPAWENELAIYYLAHAASHWYRSILLGDVADETHYGHRFLLDDIATRSPARVVQRFADAPIRRDVLRDPVSHWGDHYERLQQSSGQVWLGAEGVCATTYLIVKRWLPRLLHNLDIHCGAWGIEARLPFADTRLVDLARRVHPSVALREGTEKWLLRRAAAPLLPDDVRWRRRSALPNDQAVGDIYQAEARRLISEVEDFLGELLDLKQLRRLCDTRHTLSESERALLFRIIVLAHWVRHYQVRSV